MHLINPYLTQSDGAAEYTECIFPEGLNAPK